LVDALTICGVSQDDIGIVSLYRQQLKLITSMLAGKDKIELLTADKSQGRDKECIIISMVRSNDKQHVSDRWSVVLREIFSRTSCTQTGELLKDWRRINVALTRARSKLIIFGSRRTLSSLPVLSEFLDLMQEKGWILSLTPGTERLHDRTEEDNVIPPKRKSQPSLEGQENVVAKKIKMVKEGKKISLAKTKRTILGDIVNNLS
jgi:DNA replication ATP-dependent helicase Dna2